MNTSLVDIIEDYVLDSHLTGSNYICDPPVEDTDIDIAILINKGDLQTIGDLLVSDGWKVGGSIDFLHTWGSFKKGKLNYIIIEDSSFYAKYVDATEEAKRRNLLKKEERIALFREFLR